MKNVLGSRLLRSIRPAESVLTMYDKSVLETLGMITVTVVNPRNSERYVVDFYVTKADHTPILGAEACQDMMFLTINDEYIAAVTSFAPVTSSRNPLSLESIKRDYGDLFTGYGKFKGKLHLQTDPSVRRFVCLCVAHLLRSNRK